MPDSPVNSTTADATPAVKATAQSQSATGVAGVAESDEYAGRGTRYLIGPGVTRAVRGRPYERQEGEPLYRPLRIYTLDPSASSREGRITVLRIPWEHLAPGPVGKVFAVVDERGDRRNEPVDLDATANLLTSGRHPSPSDPQFHQQMLYAVGSALYAVFRTALGRPVAWGFEERPNSRYPNQLILRPHGVEERNAYYDKHSGEVCFGYFTSEPEVLGRNIPKAPVFTCLSHDIVVHEITHALLDGLRSRFMWPSSGDVLAFHEAFADLVAFLQRFSYEKVVTAALQESRGQIDKAAILIGLARQFSETTGTGEALRRALDLGLDPQVIRQHRLSPEPHLRGTVLVAAVFDAFDTVYLRKIERYIRLATNGTGVLPEGYLNTDLLQMLAKEASQTASQFLSICIRAIDYCPPVDVEFGEYLRALITADRALVPDDPWNYREALIDAFRLRGIYPAGVESLTEDALLWREPMRAVPPWPPLSFAVLRFRGDPGDPANEQELERQACALGRLVTEPGNQELFGLVDRTAPAWSGQDVDLPVVQSIRSTRRIGPDGQVVFDLVGEVTQRRTVKAADGGTLDFYGGSTVLIGPDGRVRYTINKRICHDGRANDQRQYVAGEGNHFWVKSEGHWKPHPQAFRLLHSNSFRG